MFEVMVFIFLRHYYMCESPAPLEMAEPWEGILPFALLTHLTFALTIKIHPQDFSLPPP